MTAGEDLAGQHSESRQATAREREPECVRRGHLADLIVLEVNNCRHWVHRFGSRPHAGGRHAM